MLVINEGVTVVGNRYTQAIMKAGQQAYGELGLDCTLTSGLEGDHTAINSYHHQGRALDLRIWRVPDVQALAARLRALLPKYYDVVVEKDHIHVEADAKKELA